jgi:dimethylargininase
MIALTRAVSPRIAECELSFIDREPIDYKRAVVEHLVYERVLADLGCTVVQIEEAPDHPDGVFVEDAAVVMEDFAVITRPGADSRLGETRSVAEALRPYRTLQHVVDPGTVDGGDVLRVGDTLYVGRSQRTNDEGIDQLGAWCRVVPIDFSGCLHLKSAVTAIGPRTLLANRDWVDTRQFDGFEVIDVEEPHAGNALRIGQTVVMASYPRTVASLRRQGYVVRVLDVSELAKAEAGVTCCSLLVE